MPAQKSDANKRKNMMAFHDTDAWKARIVETARVFGHEQVGVWMRNTIHAAVESAEREAKRGPATRAA